ncbi:MAG: alpha/beta hydrolase family protein [Wenzhouxiangella sp.]
MNSHGHGQAPETLSLTTVDGYRIGARRFPASGTLSGRIVVAGATGVPQGFYKRFASFAQSRGYETLTLDYRGIGLSAPDTLKGFRAHYLDWARVDLAATIDSIPDDGLPLYLVGHSYGGHALGLLPNQQRITRSVLFGTGAGWAGWMPPMERLRVWAMWYLIGPLLTRWKGYLPWSRLGMGEDLPLDVYRQWRDWCRHPNYFFDVADMADEIAGFRQVCSPIAAVNAADDRWAPPVSRNAFMRGYSASDWQAIDLAPQSLGLSSIGHMGYFRANAQPLWERTLDWIDGLETRFPSPG